MLEVHIKSDERAVGYPASVQCEILLWIVSWSPPPLSLESEVLDCWKQLLDTARESSAIKYQLSIQYCSLWIKLSVTAMQWLLNLNICMQLTITQSRIGLSACSWSQQLRLIWLALNETNYQKDHVFKSFIFDPTCNESSSLWYTLVMRRQL